MDDNLFDFEVPLLENWNNQNQRNRFLLKLKIRDILNKLSGNNLTTMLSSVLSSEEKKAINNNTFTALRNFSEFSNSAKLKEKFKYIRCLKQAGLSLDFSKNLGFKVSKHLWSTCSRGDARKKGGRPKINEEIQNQIGDHLKKFSSIASNRMVKESNGEKVSARYCDDTIKEAYKKFLSRIQNGEIRCEKVSFSSFNKYVGVEYKKPHRLTDLCDYCEYGKKIKSDIKTYALQNGLNRFDTDLDLDHLLENFSQNKTLHKLAIDKINDLKEVEYHKKIALQQRNEYNSMRKDVNLLKKNILIELDFKQKIVIGTSPRQVNSEYYNQELRGLLGKYVFKRILTF